MEGFLKVGPDDESIGARGWPDARQPVKATGLGGIVVKKSSVFITDLSRLTEPVQASPLPQFLFLGSRENRLLHHSERSKVTSATS